MMAGGGAPDRPGRYDRPPQLHEHGSVTQRRSGPTTRSSVPDAPPRADLSLHADTPSRTRDRLTASGEGLPHREVAAGAVPSTGNVTGITQTLTMLGRLDRDLAVDEVLARLAAVRSAWDAAGVSCPPDAPQGIGLPVSR